MSNLPTLKENISECGISNLLFAYDWFFVTSTTHFHLNVRVNENHEIERLWDEAVEAYTDLIHSLSLMDWEKLR
jgi:hypothetical protein